MARRQHYTSEPSEGRGDPLTPDEQTKVEFGRHLQTLLRSRNWSQSDLWRAVQEANPGVKLGRDSISTYVRGRSFPTTKSVTILAKALGVTEAELFPNGPINAVKDEMPSFEMKAAAGHPGKAWVRVSRMMSFATAAKIAALLNEEDERGVATA